MDYSGSPLKASKIVTERSKYLAICNTNSSLFSPRILAIHGVFSTIRRLDVSKLLQLILRGNLDLKGG